LFSSPSVIGEEKISKQSFNFEPYNWDDAENIKQQIFYRELKIDPKISFPY
jgi:hypothetical protein